MDFSLKTTVEGFVKEIDDCSVTIALDWLSVYFTHQAIFSEKYTEGDEIKINDDIYLLEINRPTLHFNSHFILFYN